MAKESGLGDNLWVDGYDLGGDVGSLSRVGWTRALLDVTGITKSAFERIPGQADGGIDFMSFFNDADGHSFPVLKNPPTTDSMLIWGHGSAIGDVAGCISAKRADYTPTRGNDGSLTITTSAQANGYAIDLGYLLTAGARTDTGATNGSSLNGGAATTTGWAAYLQVLDFAGTDVTVTLEDSANNSAFASFTGSAFTQVTAGPTFERIAGAAGATVRQYVRVATSTTGGFTSVTFVVGFTRTPAA